MTVQEAIQQLEHASVAERIQAIELLLHSLKDEFSSNKPTQAMHRPFRIRTFNLGTDTQVDREEMYADRLF